MCVHAFKFGSGCVCVCVTKGKSCSMWEWLQSSNTKPCSIILQSRCEALFVYVVVGKCICVCVFVFSIQVFAASADFEHEHVGYCCVCPCSPKLLSRWKGDWDYTNHSRRDAVMLFLSYLKSDLWSLTYTHTLTIAGKFSKNWCVLFPSASVSPEENPSIFISQQWTGLPDINTWAYIHQASQRRKSVLTGQKSSERCIFAPTFRSSSKSILSTCLNIGNYSYLCQYLEELLRIWWACRDTPWENRCFGNAWSQWTN